MKRLILISVITTGLLGCNLSDDGGGAPANNANSANNANNTNNTNNTNNINNMIDMGVDMADVCVDPAEDCPAPQGPEYVYTCEAEACVETCAPDHNAVNGACIPGCALADCGQGFRCDDQEGMAETVCDCAPGTTLVNDACVLAPLPGEEIDTGDWLTEGAAQQILFTDGDGGIGRAIFDADAICGTGGRLSQEIDLGTFEEIGPVVLKFRYRYECGSSFCEAGAIPAAFVNDKVFFTLPEFNEFEALNDPMMRSASVCLGRGFGGEPMKLGIGPANPPVSCDPGFPPLADLIITSVSLEADVDGTCPSETHIVNGTFDDALNGWTANQYASLVDNAGNPRVLLGGPRCRGGIISQKVLTPESPANGGLLLSATVESPVDGAESLSASFGLTDIVGRRGNSQFRYKIELEPGTPAKKWQVCLPSAVHDNILDLQFQRPSPTGSCDAEEVQPTFIDDITIEASAECDSTSVTTGDFESPYLAWVYTEPTSSNTRAVFSIETEDNNSFMRLKSETICGSVSATTLLSFGPNMLGEIPNAVRFRYRTANPTADRITRISFGDESEPLADATDWTNRDVCLSSANSGYSPLIYVSHSITAGVTA